jgi:hypothetical protein
MLPKPQKNKKTKIEQQDIFQKINQEKNVRLKRNYLLISIFLTIGLSFIFYSFNQIKFWFNNFTFSSHQIPKISVSNPINSASNILKKDTNDWLIIVKTPETYFINKDKEIDTHDYFDSLLENTISPSSIASSLLPQGINYRQSIKDLESKYIYTSEIILPKNSFYIHIEISGLSNLKDSISKVPEVIQKIYWATVPLL